MIRSWFKLSLSTSKILKVMVSCLAATRRKTIGKLVESISLDEHNNRRFAVVCAYKPPTVDNAVFTSELTALLDEAMGQLTVGIICERIPSNIM